MAHIEDEPVPTSADAAACPSSVPAPSQRPSEKVATLIEVHNARSESCKRYSRAVAQADAEVYARKQELDLKLSNAYLGRFLFLFKHYKTDNITSKYLRHQVKVQPEHVRWLQTNLERGRSELLDSIVVAVSPRYLAVASQKDIQESTKSNLSVVQFAKEITLAQKNKDEEGMKEVRHKYTFPDVPHRVMWTPRKVKTEDKLAGSWEAIHLLDGQKRVAALRNIQGRMVSSAQNKFNQVEGFAYNWDLIQSEQELLDYLVQRPEPMRNVISGADQFKRKLILFGDLFLPNYGRYKKVIEDYERKERPSATAPGTGEPSSTKTTSYRLDELVLGPRSLRVSLQSSLFTGHAFDVFRYEPYHDLLKADLPELATYAASLWAYQQRVISNDFAVGDAPCDLYVRHRPGFLFKEALSIRPDTPFDWDSSDIAFVQSCTTAFNIFNCPKS